jgi:hypothetical protein
MWVHFYHQPWLTTPVYLGLILGLFAVYGLILKHKQKHKQEIRVWPWLILLAPLLLSYNALSFDVFNYIFNARMVVKYQTNPHLSTALNFAHDPWMRFMHNVHTPAPYGYGWTAFSLLPYILGGGKFVLTWLSFRLFSLLSLLLLPIVWRYLAASFKQIEFKPRLAAAVLLNPLIMIEIVSNSHNDLWMVLPAMLSLALLGANRQSAVRGNQQEDTDIAAVPKIEKVKIGIKLLSSLLLLIFSISTKLASVVLLPIWLLLLFKKLRILGILGMRPRKVFFSCFAWLQAHWPLLASMLLFLPLLTPRSQQFHPWYLTWSLVWLPLIKVERENFQGSLGRGWLSFLLILSLSSMLRYLPWMLQQDYTAQVLWQQKLITWVPAVGYALIYGARAVTE